MVAHTTYWNACELQVQWDQPKLQNSPYPSSLGYIQMRMATNTMPLQAAFKLPSIPLPSTRYWPFWVCFYQSPIHNPVVALKYNENRQKNFYTATCELLLITRHLLSLHIARKIIISTLLQYLISCNIYIHIWIIFHFCHSTTDLCVVQHICYITCTAHYLGSVMLEHK